MERAQVWVNEGQPELFEIKLRLRQPRFRGIEKPVWTEHKAKLISQYLRYFVLVTKHGVYIDGFAGPQDRDRPDCWAAKLVLENEPRWMRNFFLCDKNSTKAAYLKKLRDDQPEVKDRTIDVVHADFNSHVDTVLATDKINEKTATFCLLDQRTFECDWETVQKIAKRKSNMKIEIFYFVPTGWLARSIEALSDPEPTMMRWWDRKDWEELRQMNNHDIAQQFCQRFKRELSYEYAHPWPIFEHQDSQRIMYYMVHATDHYHAPELMNRAYRCATNRDEPSEQFDLELGKWGGD